VGGGVGIHVAIEAERDRLRDASIVTAVVAARLPL